MILTSNIVSLHVNKYNKIPSTSFKGSPNGEVKENKAVNVVSPSINGRDLISTDRKYITEEYKKLNHQEMLNDPAYLKRALMLSKVYKKETSRFSRMYSGANILDILWNPNPNMKLYTQGCTKLAQVLDSDQKSFYDGNDAVNILSDPNLDVDLFVQKSKDFLMQCKNSPFGEKFFTGADVATIIKQGLEEKILFELNQKVDVQKYSANDCIAAAKMLDFYGIENADNLSIEEKISLRNILVGLNENDLSSENLHRDFPFLPYNLDELSRKISDIVQSIKSTPVKKEDLPYLEFDNSFLDDEDFKKLDSSAANILKAAYSFQKCSPDILPYVLTQFGSYDEEAIDSIVRIVEQKNILEKTNIDDKTLKYMAFRLQNNENLELLRLLMKLGQTDYCIDEMVFTNIKKYINEIQEQNFILPQTSKDEILAVSKQANINGYDVQIAKSSDIQDFYSLCTTFYPWFAHNPNHKLAFSRFEVNSMADSNKTSCFSYIGSDKLGNAGEYGILADVNPLNIYVASGWDLWSQSRMSFSDICVNYFFEGKNARNLNTGKPSENRSFMAESIKEQAGLSSENYKNQINEIIRHFKNKPVTFKALSEFNTEFAKNMKAFLSNDESVEGKQKFLMRSKDHNEILASNPKIKGIYTTTLSKLPVEYFEYASKNGLPIVILSK